MQIALYDLQDAIANALLPWIEAASPVITDMIEKFVEWDDAADGWITKGALIGGALWALSRPVRSLIGLLRSGPAAVRAFQAALGTLGLAPIPITLLVSAIVFGDEIDALISEAIGIEPGTIDRYLNQGIHHIIDDIQDIPNQIRQDWNDIKGLFTGQNTIRPTFSGDQPSPFEIVPRSQSPGPQSSGFQIAPNQQQPTAAAIMPGMSDSHDTYNTFHLDNVTIQTNDPEDFIRQMQSYIDQGAVRE